MDRADSILIVDDDPEIRRLLVDYLARNGYAAHPARDGREMKLALERQTIDLVVLDLMLPDSDGLTLCRDLRANERTQNLPVLMLTAPDGVAIPLSGGEYRLLRILLDHPNRVLTRDQLCELIHGREAEAYDRAIDVQISRLRQRLRDDSREPQLVKTVRGEGYVLACTVEGRDACA